MHDIESSHEGYVASIDKVILHEDFESDYLHDTNDIALIRLKHLVKFDENVRPACLPHKGEFRLLAFSLFIIFRRFNERSNYIDIYSFPFLFLTRS